MKHFINESGGGREKVGGKGGAKMKAKAGSGKEEGVSENENFHTILFFNFYHYVDYTRLYLFTYSFFK